MRRRPIYATGPPPREWTTQERVVESEIHTRHHSRLQQELDDQMQRSLDIERANIERMNPPENYQPLTEEVKERIRNAAQRWSAAERDRREEERIEAWLRDGHARASLPPAPHAEITCHYFNPETGREVFPGEHTTWEQKAWTIRIYPNWTKLRLDVVLWSPRRRLIVQGYPDGHPDGIPIPMPAICSE